MKRSGPRRQVALSTNEDPLGFMNISPELVFVRSPRSVHASKTLVGVIFDGRT